MTLKDLLLVILVTCTWGLNYVFVKIGVASIPPIFFCALKFIVCSALISLFKFKTQLKWQLIAKMGMVLGVFTFSLLYLGIQLGVPSGIASLLMQAQMIFTIVLSALVLRDRFSGLEWAGIILAFGGLYGITHHSGGGGNEMISGIGVVLIFGAAFAGGLSNIIVKKAGSIDNFELITWMSLVPPIPLLVISYFFEDHQFDSIRSINGVGIVSIFYGSIFSTVFGYGLWGKILKKYSPSTVAPLLLLVPVFGILFSYLILGEQLTSLQLLAAAIVLVGLVITIIGNQRRLNGGMKNF